MVLLLVDMADHIHQEPTKILEARSQPIFLAHQPSSDLGSRSSHIILILPLFHLVPQLSHLRHLPLVGVFVDLPPKKSLNW